MANPSDAADSAKDIVSGLDAVSEAFESGFLTRLFNLGTVQEDWEGYLVTVQAAGLSLLSLALICAGAVVVAHYLARAIEFLIERRIGRSTGWKRGLTTLAVVLATLFVMVLLTRVAFSDETTRTVARFWVLASLIVDLARKGLVFTLRSNKGDEKTAAAAAAFVRHLCFAVMVALYGIAVNNTLRIFAAGAGLRDLVGAIVVPTAIALLMLSAYWRHRRTVSALILGPDAQSPPRQKLASLWPWAALAVILLTFTAEQAAMTIGRPLPPLPTFLTLMLVLIAPHLDAVAADWAERGLEAPEVPVLVVAWQRTFRFVIGVTIFSMLSYIWLLPILAAMGFDPLAIGASVMEVGFIALFAAFLWNAVGVLTGRVKIAEQRGREALEEAEPQSRLGTILPLIVGTSKAAILSIGILSVMIAVGINVLPILGGLSVFGLAIGFGSQTLVKDIVAGLFFLTDDAFRMGEYVETQGSKGTVEKISIRSVSLRNPRGPVAVVPYGQIGKVTNFSRGWVIEKYVFRVAFDTDVDLVRKLFKKIGQDVAANPELAADLLEPFKSQGIGMVEDGTLVLRGKFKARAGHQFAIKKAVLAAVQQAFTDNGIKAIPKPFV